MAATLTYVTARSSKQIAAHELRRDVTNIKE
jgi:hypothetical protein